MYQKTKGLARLLLSVRHAYVGAGADVGVGVNQVHVPWQLQVQSLDEPGGLTTEKHKSENSGSTHASTRAKQGTAHADKNAMYEDDPTRGGGAAGFVGFRLTGAPPLKLQRAATH